MPMPPQPPPAVIPRAMVLARLQETFGHSEFREGQEKVIHSILDGHATMAIFPTGAGKSLCYQLPAVLLEGMTLVVSPLLALMKDQAESLQRRGIAAARLDSTLTPEESAAVLEKMGHSGWKILFVAPERFGNPLFVKELRRTRVSLFVVDEAHCISEWGHNFRPDYLRLATIARRHKWRRVLALTATAAPQVAKEIAETFRISRPHRFTNSFVRSNLALHVTPCKAVDRLALLTETLRTKALLPAIVYVTQQLTAEMVATHLQRTGFSAQAYHAGLPAEHRNEVQDAFMQGRTDIIVATIAFGMGIDKANIRAVYHFNLPKTLENYQQEIGRSGRDGQSAHCEMFACGDDLTVLRNFIHGDTPTPQALRQLVDALLRLGNEFEVSHYDISRANDVRTAVLETVFTYLEIAGILLPQGPQHSEFLVKFSRSTDSLLSGFPAKQQSFLRKLFASGDQKWYGLRLTVADAVEATGVKRQRIVDTLQELVAAGEISLQPRRVQQLYQRGVAGADVESVVTGLQTLFANREVRDRERLEQVEDFAADPRCLTKRLVGYFGEKLSRPCGTCSSCLHPGRKPRRIPFSSIPDITTADVAILHEIIAEKQPALSSPRALTRFLCGITSPAILRDKLTRHHHFGCLGAVPFQDVLNHTETMILR